MTERTNVDAMACWRELRPLARLGYDLFPLCKWDAVRADGVKLGKTPLQGAWRSNDYSLWEWLWWFRQGGNVGIRARPVDLIIDVDPRNGGVESLRKLTALLGFDPTLDALTTVTGRRDGGRHAFLGKPADLLIKKNLPDYPGLDFISEGFYVVAPGSTHPDTGHLYKLTTGLMAGAPSALLDLLKRPPPVPRTGDGGEVSNADLSMLLRCLDPKAFRDYGDWISLAAACHDATDGQGFREWADWCQSDPQYADVADERLEHHWDSFEAGKRAGSTYRTLFHHVSKAGHADKLKSLGTDYNSAADDFIEDYE